jgi:hypothetical protein
LASDEGVETVDSRYAGLDEFIRVVAGVRVDWVSVDVVELVGDDGRAIVFRLAESAEDPAEDVWGEGEFEGSGKEPDGAFADVDTARALEDLKERLVVFDLEDLAVAD